MASPTLAQIEDGLLTVLRDSTTLGNYCRTIASYAGQLEADLSAFPVNCPAIYAMLESTTATQRAQQLQEKTATWSFFLIEQNLRGNEASRRGAAGSVGTYQMLQDLQRLLLGNRLGLEPELNGFWQLGEQSILNTARWSIYQAQYRTFWRIRAGEE